MTAVSEHLLVVDDDPELRDLLARYLGEQGFRVSSVADGTAMDAALARELPNLIILDLMLPGEDGLSIARRLRAQYQIPIIILSARGEEVDRIIGLEVGADDYLPKPFSPRELLARIRAVLRRPAQPVAVTTMGLRFGPFELDVERHVLMRAGKEITLTAGEFALLRVLTEHPNQVLSRDRLIDLLKGYDRSPFDRSVDVRVTRLRRKIEDDPAAPEYLRTVWGEGYLFSPAGRRLP
ncbi:MAG: response regulator [Gammaproteobacteria bacterium]|nr:response regulator [Gammaproteobacteria bacterium]